MWASRAYQLQRFVRPAAARAYPIRVNGSIFTVDPSSRARRFRSDWRRWGDFWWQNTPPYHPMLPPATSRW
jgi:hypothetical protein